STWCAAPTCATWGSSACRKRCGARPSEAPPREGSGVQVVQALAGRLAEPLAGAFVEAGLTLQLLDLGVAELAADLFGRTFAVGPGLGRRGAGVGAAHALVDELLAGRGRPVGGQQRGAAKQGEGQQAQGGGNAHRYNSLCGKSMQLCGPGEGKSSPVTHRDCGQLWGKAVGSCARRRGL